MDPAFWELFGQVLLEVLTFVVLIFGLLGLLMPVFPGLTVMWIATLIYAIVQAGLGNMTWVGWVLFVLITLLMIGGNIVDNIIIAKHMRDKDVPWSSILWSFAAGILASLFFTPIVGIFASPVGLFLAEWYRLKDRPAAVASTKAWLTGWGWSVAARIGIGVVMILFWGLWAWAIG
ncbi:MAG: DUF456 domain-containing protein [Anaerolineae bacterium]|nr:DUF456 domain-containing protein [Anaerolineae bacterium]